MIPRIAALTVLIVVVSACAVPRSTLEQRSTQGPSAEQMWTVSVFMQNGREPTFDEKLHWQDAIDERIRVYLIAHPEVANSLNVSQFKFSKQVAVGMDKEQVTILLGEPLRSSTDAAEMQNVARGYWPSVRGKATEVLVYPLGWALFFDGPRLVDITQYVPGNI